MKARFQSSILFVRDIQASRRFYEHLLGQEVFQDYGPFVGFTGGLDLWQFNCNGQPVQRTGNGSTPKATNGKSRELYFESDEPEALWARLTRAGVQVAQPVQEQPWGQRVFRVYDPDGHIVEIAEPMPVVVRRFLAAGMPEEAVAERTMMPLIMVQQIAETV
jgi:catechol 2,3-dioxygenase-like lactoylglutathione lyase family enzyme